MSENKNIETWSKGTHQGRIRGWSLLNPTKMVTGWYARLKGHEPRGPFWTEEEAIEAVKDYDLKSE